MALNNIPHISIGELEFSILQGGMGVGVSLSGLAAAVSEEYGAGTIASVGIGILKGYFHESIVKNRELIRKTSPELRKGLISKLYAESNAIALKEEINRARRLTNGVIGVNIMHALSDYSSLVTAAIEENVDFIVSGAGIPRDLPKYLNGKKTKLIPIVSSAKLAQLMCISWTKMDHPPDAVVVEGPLAGGHLGYSFEQLSNAEFLRNGLEQIISEVVKVVKSFETSSHKIPVIAAGGIYYGGDITRILEKGAATVQMATRLVTTKECDASNVFKQEYIKCKKDDLKIIHSPVGMPGRAIMNDFLREVEEGKKHPFSCPYLCLKTCKQKESPYCIANALTKVVVGNLSAGYVFAGANAYLCNEITSVKEVFSKLDEEVRRKVTSER